MAPVFGYLARDAAGKQVKGSLDADSERSVAAQLRTNGLFPISIQGSRGAAAISTVRSGAGTGRPSSQGGGLAGLLGSGVGIGDLAVLCRQLAVMVRAGLPILKSLAILADQAPKKVLRVALQQVYTDVQGGSSLAAALSRHPRIFPRMLVFMIQAAEAGGALEVIVERLALHYEKEKELKAKISQAMMYPIVISVVAVVVVNILVLFVLPQFSSLFVGQALPPQTRFLLWLPGATRHYGVFLVAGVVAALGGLKAYTSTEQGAYQRDLLVLKLSVMGDIVRKIATARFCRTFSTLVGSGITVLASLELVQNVITNRVMMRGLSASQESIRQGSGLAGPLEATKVFPTMVTQMIRVGEETGGLEEVLTKVADFYDGEVDSGMKIAVGLIEPAVLVVMGGVTAMIVSSILIPMFDMMGNM